MGIINFKVLLIQTMPIHNCCWGQNLLQLLLSAPSPAACLGSLYKAFTTCCEKPLTSSINFHSFSLKLFPPCPIAIWPCKKSVSLLPISSSTGRLQWGHPETPSSPGWTRPVPSVSLHRGVLQPYEQLHGLLWTHSDGSVSLCQGIQTEEQMQTIPSAHCHPSVHAAQDTVCLLGCKCTLLVHVEFLITYHPKVPPVRLCSQSDSKLRNSLLTQFLLSFYRKITVI